MTYNINYFSLCEYTTLTWKLILVLSNGAIMLLAKAPAIAPAVKLCNTFVDSLKFD